MKNAAGMTIVELLVSCVILTLISAVTVYAGSMASRMIQLSETESSLSADGKYLMEMIQTGERSLHGLVKARSNSIVIDADLRGIGFAVDKNAEITQTTADDITMRVALDTGDGNVATTEDNSLFVDPNTGVGGDAFTLGGDIEDLTFTVNGEIVTANLTLVRTTRGQPMRLEMSRDIWVRN